MEGGGFGNQGFDLLTVSGGLAQYLLLGRFGLLLKGGRFFRRQVCVLPALTHYHPAAAAASGRMGGFLCKHGIRQQGRVSPAADGRIWHIHMLTGSTGGGLRPIVSLRPVVSLRLSITLQTGIGLTVGVAVSALRRLIIARHGHPVGLGAAAGPG